MGISVMNAREQSVIHHAVVFFDAGHLVKEMLHVEFEAVLDQVVGMQEFAGREIGACFVRINPRLQIIGAVFFLVDFDQRGYVNRSWNVPLEHLLETAGRGPDLGAGRIRLSCRSQCSIAWHSRQLWDPVLEGKNNNLQQLQQAVRRNRLGLAEEDPPELEAEAMPPPLLETHAGESTTTPNDERQLAERINKRLQQEYRSKLVALKEAQQLQLATFKSSAQEQMDQLHQRFQLHVSQLKETLQSTKQMFIDEKRRSQAYKDKLDTQVAEFAQLRQQMQRELAQERGNEQNQVQKLQEQFEVELKARVEQASAELKEMLDMREVELFYREEQLGNLREEVTRLRQAREGLVNQSGDRLLHRLVESGITFVAYQPGAEAMSIPLGDVVRYLDAPLAYAAEKSFVAPEQYQLWLSHFELPVCTAPVAGGSICGEPLTKVERPSQFMSGSSDRCSEHADHGPKAAHRHSGT